MEEGRINLKRNPKHLNRDTLRRFDPIPERVFWLSVVVFSSSGVTSSKAQTASLLSVPVSVCKQDIPATNSSICEYEYPNLACTSPSFLKFLHSKLRCLAIN